MAHTSGTEIETESFQLKDFFGILINEGMIYLLHFCIFKSLDFNLQLFSN